MDAKVLFCVLYFFIRLGYPWTPISPHFTRRLRYPWTPTTLLFMIDFCCCILDLIFRTIWLPTTMVNRKCCVPNCGNKQSDNIILHLFPNPINDPERFRTWLYAIGGEILALENDHIFKKCRVCHSHFETKYNTISKRLTANAVPTLHLTGFAVKRKSLSDITNKIIKTNDLQQPSTSKQFMETLEMVQPEQPVTKGFAVKQKSLSDVTNKVTNTNDMQQPSTSKQFMEMEQPEQPVTKGSKQINKNKTLKKNLGYVFSSEASIMTRQIKKLKAANDKYTLKLKKALKLSENTTFQKAIKKFTATALIFTLLQFREINKNKMGRRFTKKEKIMALSLYKQGPRAYRWLRNIFVLPAPVTLSRLITRASLRPGINENLFQQLKKRARNMSETDKLCILMFDEVALAPHFDYNRKRDEIIGFVNDGVNVTKKIADHALVFMIRGIVRNYKQPVAYTFCSGSTSKLSLAVQIKGVIRKLKSVGFNVLATVCDQGASNKSAINYLIQETREKYVRLNKEFRHNIFEIDDKEVVPLYDPPHLIKGIRNNLLNKNLVCKIGENLKTAKWEHIMALYAQNPAYKGIRMLPKLTEQHVNPKKIAKMKVKCATQVFSRSVGTTMGFLAENKILNAECAETADVILFLDDIFDSVNGGYANQQRRSGKPLLGALTPNSCHQKIWLTSKTVFKSMKFVDDKGRLSVVPSVTNWIWTIDNLEYLTNKIFREFDVKSIWLRHFNQDPLENFFGSVRSHGITNRNPTCAGFEAAFAALLINNLSNIHSLGSNCEKDDCYMFPSLKKIFFTSCDIVHGTTEINFDHVVSDDIIVGIEYKKNHPKIMAPIEYVTGYILRKSTKVIKNCKECKSCLYDRTKASAYIRLKDYSKTKSYLSYPSNDLVKYFSDIQDVVTYILKNDSSIKNIKSYIKTLISIHCECNFLKCDKHKEKLLSVVLDQSCNFFLNNWCRDNNKILKGLRPDIDQSDIMNKMSHDYFLKRYNKSTTR